MLGQAGNSSIARAGLLVSLIFAGQGAFGLGLEQPEYTVIYKSGDIEYRQYVPYTVSEAVVAADGDYREAGQRGVDRLLEYIGGDNTTEMNGSEKISMTLPVQQTNTSEGWRVSLMLPSEYTAATAPAPTHPGVSLREVPGRLMAVRRFSGRWTQKNFAAKMDELQAATEADAVEHVGEIHLAMYNPPFIPPFMRRNEVMVEVANLPEAAADELAVRHVAAF